MKETLDAIYENGIFRPLQEPVGIPEHRRVTITVTTEGSGSSLADCVNRISADDAAEMKQIVEREFEHIDPREWA
ncbi:MAG: antitoxin family protein [Acidobacteriota bacterium]